MILSHLMYNAKGFSFPYLSSASNSIARYHDLPHYSYFQNMLIFCSLLPGHAVTCLAAATTCPSPPARLYKSELNSVSGSCFAGSVWCQEFLGGRSESNMDAQENAQGLRDACYRQWNSRISNSFPC